VITLDTSALIGLFRGSDDVEKLLDNDDLTTTVITYHEILSGLKHKRAKNEERFFKRLFSEISVLNFDATAAEKSSDIMATLLSLGMPTNSLDVLIAGIAIANGAEELVTKDRDFENIAKVAEIKVIFLD
jgi:tRNA(fMet)-specific endonuclease VapC